MGDAVSPRAKSQEWVKHDAAVSVLQCSRRSCRELLFFADIRLGLDLGFQREARKVTHPPHRPAV
jgi:hypothetical protein